MNFKDVMSVKSKAAMSFGGDKITLHKHKEILQKDTSASISNYLSETEEWNDLIITDRLGNLVFLFSRFGTLDENYISSFKPDFKNLIDKLLDPEKHIEDYNKTVKNINDYFYEKGLHLMNRHFKITRLAIPFIFSRDKNNNEELVVIKAFNTFSNMNLLIYITYFQDYSSPLIIGYLKPFLEIYDTNIKIDDDFKRF